MGLPKLSLLAGITWPSSTCAAARLSVRRSTSVLLVLFVGLLPDGLAQTSSDTEPRNEIGLVMGAFVTPSQTLAGGVSATPRTLTFKPSLAMGAEFDRRVNHSDRLAILIGVDFLASPFDVKLDQRPAAVIPEYAYLSLTPHIRAKFHPRGAISPWLLFGGGYARYTEAAPPASPTFKAGRNTGALEFGGGVDTRTVVRILRVPIGFRLAVRDFYTGLPNYNLAVDANRQHSVVFTGGLLIRF
jgi:hypothetical protein